MPFRLAAAAALGVLMVVPTAASAQVLMQRDVSLRMALAIAEAALAECGDRTSVAIVDRAGRLRVFLQGDNANPHNIELARRKAYTARTFRQPSAQWAKNTETQNGGPPKLAGRVPPRRGMPVQSAAECSRLVWPSGSVGGRERAVGPSIGNENKGRKRC